MLNLRRAGAILGLVACLVAGLAVANPGAFAQGSEKVTLCHAAGQAGTTQFVTLTIAYNAAFGPAGHFNEDGTPRAGHEQDYLGACRDDTTTTDTTDTTDTTTTTDTTDTTDTTTTTETQPPPRRCPDGKPPTPGEGAFDPNDDCARPPTETTPPVTTTPEPPPTTTEPETTTTPEPPVTTTVSEEPPVVAPKPKPKPPKATPKPPKASSTKVPPVCPVAKPTTGRCAVQGSG